MLELKKIKKIYRTSNEQVVALKDIDIKFRESEFVSVLGPSGCGKTTLLNIIGGLDRYTSGDLFINGKSTKDFKDRDWDAYRNYKVGFVFQNYNLISHQSVLSNVELALTIGGVSKKERTKRAIKALEEVGLKNQIHKKPNQLSGGQMQRVAIARALVNNPEIILADEPTGALDTKTSIQVMNILKEISKNRLIIMVTHNPELAKNYSSRIIKILDGSIVDDSNPIKEDEKVEKDSRTIGKTSMSFLTAFRLSLNNLLTKKGRTALVAFAGSIGIIGIALIQSVSNGFQDYVDKIEEDALSSYPLSISEESADITSTLLSLTSNSEKKNDNKNTVQEKMYINDMLSNISTNDLKSFKAYLEDNIASVEKNLTTIKYGYSVEPNIYAQNAKGKISKVNPSSLFSSSISIGMNTFSQTYTEMIDDEETILKSYDVLYGRLPNKYDEMMIVLSQEDAISDFLVYYLGLRDIDELNDMVKKIMNGEKTNIKNQPMTFTYEDLSNIKLKLIMPTDLYMYNSKYDIYEDMSEDSAFLNKVYDNSIDLKIVGVVTAKDGVTTMALNPGVVYTKDLIDYIINYSANTDMVKKQLSNDKIDVISGTKFNSKNNNLKLDLSDVVTVDKNKLKNAFNMDIDEAGIQNKTKDLMLDISNLVSTDTSAAYNLFKDNLGIFINNLFNSIKGPIKLNEVDNVVDNFLNTKQVANKLAEMQDEYIIPSDTFKKTYEGLLKSVLSIYINMYAAQDPTYTTDSENPGAIVISNVVSTVSSSYINNAVVSKTIDTMAKVMTEAKMKKEILTKVGELTGNLTKEIASGFNVDENQIASSFKLNMTEEKLTRIVSSMMTETKTSAKINLINLGYQDKEAPTYISFYFKNFDSKERFLNFLDTYNDKVKIQKEESKVINYTDTTGILMGSVKTIVNAVTYVLIAFVSISLIVSSIMIGIITYISVYERTKEIGILRAIGASKRNISSIFNAETFIIGMLSGLFGIGTTYILVPIINKILHHFTGNIPLNAKFYIENAMLLILLSIILTLIGGLIPAKKASNKDPVIALRTE